MVHNGMQGHGVAEGTWRTPPEKKRVAHFIECTDPLNDSFSVYALPDNRSTSAEVRPTHPCPWSLFFNKQKSLYRLVLAYSEVSIALIIIMQDYSEPQGQLRRKASDVARCARQNKETHT